MRFDQYQYGGSGADGIMFALAVAPPVPARSALAGRTIDLRLLATGKVAARATVGPTTGSQRPSRYRPSAYARATRRVTWRRSAAHARQG